MSTPSLAALVALASLLPGRAFASACLPAGMLGPDAPGCATAAPGSAAATSAVSDNLLAVAGQASAEQYTERAAIDAAGPLLPGTASAKAKSGVARARSSGVAAAPAGLGSPTLSDAKAVQADSIASAVVRGSGGAFEALAGPGAQAGGGAAAAAAAPPPTLASAKAGVSAPMTGSSAGAPNFGPAVRDAGRNLFDNASAGAADDVGASAPGAPRAPCTPLRPCANPQ